MHNFEECGMLDSVIVGFRKEEKITFAEVWQAWEPILPSTGVELKNAYSIEADEVLKLLEKIIESKPQHWAFFSVGLVTPFRGKDQVEAAIRSKFENVSIWDRDEFRSICATTQTGSLHFLPPRPLLSMKYRLIIVVILGFLFMLIN